MTYIERALMIFGVIGMAGSVFSTSYAIFKVSYQKVVGKPLPRTKLVMVIEVMIELLLNVPGAANKALQMGGSPPIFLPTQTPVPPEPSRESPPQG